MGADINFYLAATQQDLPFIFLRGFIWNRHFLSIPLKALDAKKCAVLFCLLKKGKGKSYFFNRQALETEIFSLCKNLIKIPKLSPLKSIFMQPIKRRWISFWDFYQLK